MPHKSPSLIIELVYSSIIGFEFSYTGEMSRVYSRLLGSNLKLSGSGSTVSEEQSVYHSMSEAASQ